MKVHFLVAASLLTVGVCQRGESQTSSQIQETQVCVEMQVVSVANSTWGKIADFDWIASRRYGSSSECFAFLDREEHAKLLDILRKDKRTEIIAAPKLTAFSGQLGNIAILDERRFCTDVAVKKLGEQSLLEPKILTKSIGFSACVKPTVSADRRLVKLDLGVTRTTLDPKSATPIPIQVPVPPLFDAPNGQGFISDQNVVLKTLVQRPMFSTYAADMSLNVADGATAVIVAGKEAGGNRTLLFFATPRIVIESEIEREILGMDAPPRAIKESRNKVAGSYYTGGKMKREQYRLPLDYDLTVLQAIAIYNRPIMGGGGFDLKGAVAAVTGKNDAPFGQVLVLRRDKEELTQRIVDLDRALKNSAFDLVLRDGDVLVLQEPSKSDGKQDVREEAKVYYTGGIDNPRQHPLPRDRELKVTQAIAGKLTRVGPDDPLPSEVLVIRRTKSSEQTQIRVNLARAILDPSHDPAVQNGDFLVLQESPADTLARMTRGIARDVAHIRLAPRDLSEPSEPPPSMPRR